MKLNKEINIIFNTGEKAVVNIFDTFSLKGEKEKYCIIITNNCVYTKVFKAKNFNPTLFIKFLNKVSRQFDFRNKLLV